MIEAVALGVIGLAALDGTREVRDQRRVHLAIAIDLDDDVHAFVKCRLVACAHGATDALVLFMEDHTHARVGALLLDEQATVLWTFVVDYVDAFYAMRHACDDIEHVALHLVAGDDNGDPHGFMCACQWTPM